MVAKLAELFFIIGVSTLSVIASQTGKQPFRVKVCLDGQDQVIWSDQIERYEFHAPDRIQCGKCGRPVPCPKERTIHHQ